MKNLKRNFNLQKIFISIIIVFLGLSLTKDSTAEVKKSSDFSLFDFEYSTTSDIVKRLINVTSSLKTKDSKAFANKLLPQYQMYYESENNLKENLKIWSLDGVDVNFVKIYILLMDGVTFKVAMENILQELITWTKKDSFSKESRKNRDKLIHIGQDIKSWLKRVDIYLNAFKAQRPGVKKAFNFMLKNNSRLSYNQFYGSLAAVDRDVDETSYGRVTDLPTLRALECLKGNTCLVFNFIPDDLRTPLFHDVVDWLSIFQEDNRIILQDFQEFKKRENFYYTHSPLDSLEFQYQKRVFKHLEMMNSLRVTLTKISYLTELVHRIELFLKEENFAKPQNTQDKLFVQTVLKAYQSILRNLKDNISPLDKNLVEDILKTALDRPLTNQDLKGLIKPLTFNF